jgi:hypothetical protein
LSLNPTTINTSVAPANVTVGFSVTDDLSGVGSISIIFESPSGLSCNACTQTVSASADLTAYKNSLSVTASGTATFPKNCETGVWTVWHVVLYDVIGNSSFLDASKLASMGLPTQVTVVGVGEGDTTPPVLKALSFSPTTINTANAPANVTIGFNVTDDLSGVSAMYIIFESPSGLSCNACTQTVSASPDPFKNATNVTTSAVAIFPRYSETGVWTVWHVVLYDAVGNASFIDASHLAAMGFPTQIRNSPN